VLTVGKGSPATTFFGKGSWIGGGGDAGVSCGRGSGGVDVRFLLADSRELRAGNFLFRSMIMISVPHNGGGVEVETRRRG